MLPDIGNRRADKRVKVPAVIKFRRNTVEERSPWDMTLVRNISKSGIFFNSTFRFQEGEELEIKMHNPYTKTVDHYTAIVTRSIAVLEGNLYCETAVSIKEIFNQSLRSFSAFMDNSLAAV